MEREYSFLSRRTHGLKTRDAAARLRTYHDRARLCPPRGRRWPASEYRLHPRRPMAGERHRLRRRPEREDAEPRPPRRGERQLHQRRLRLPRLQPVPRVAADRPAAGDARRLSQRCPPLRRRRDDRPRSSTPPDTTPASSASGTSTAAGGRRTSRRSIARGSSTGRCSNARTITTIRSTSATARSGKSGTATTRSRRRPTRRSTSRAHAHTGQAVRAVSLVGARRTIRTTPRRRNTARCTTRRRSCCGPTCPTRRPITPAKNWPATTPTARALDHSPRRAAGRRSATPASTRTRSSSSAPTTATCSARTAWSASRSRGTNRSACRCSGTIPLGTRETRASKVDAVMSTEDVLPTMLGLCGIEIPKSIEGLDYSGYHARAARAPIPTTPP